MTKKKTEENGKSDAILYEYKDGSKSYYHQFSEMVGYRKESYTCRHREDGPAVIRPNNHTEYWIEGERLTETEWKNRKVRTNV